jgi:DDE family transposase
MNNTINDVLITLFCTLDDFCNSFEPEWHATLLQHTDVQKLKKTTRIPSMTLSEVITIVIHFHQLGYRTFKQYYNCHVQGYLKAYFPKLVSYSRFVRLMSQAAFPMFCFLQTLLGTCTGISFIDSTVLTVCHNRRINSHKTFQDMAKRGKTSTGWFFGFKLHLIINDQGEILAYMLTAGNIDDRKPVHSLCQHIFGKLFGDKGYISSKLFADLYEQGVQLITKLKSNMKNQLMDLYDRLMLRKRGLVESVHNRLKNGSQIEHHRHRSPWNFLVNLVGGLAAYSLLPQKPHLELPQEELLPLLAA